VAYFSNLEKMALFDYVILEIAALLK